MPDETNKLIQDQFRKLPNDVMAMLLSPNFERNIKFIIERHIIPIEKEVSFENEVFLLILGLSDPEEFRDTLAQSLNIPQEEVEIVIRDIDRFILAPIKNSLTTFFQTENNQPDEITTTTKSAQTTTQKENPTPKNEVKKNQPPSNLPVIEPHLEPMIVEPGTPFLPPLMKKNVNHEARITNHDAAGTQEMKQEPRITNYEKEEASKETPPLAPKIPPQATTQATPQTKNIDAVKMALSAEISSLLNKHPEANESQAPKVQQTPITRIATKPEDKMSAITESPRVEVHMEKTPTPQPSSGKQADPYREAIG